MDKRELAWSWFVDKYGLVIDWEFDGNDLKIESCGKRYEIIFGKRSVGDIAGDPLEIIGKALSGELDGEHTWPFLDELSDALLESIRSSIDVLIRKKFWREGNFALCLTHDVDEIRKTYQFFTRGFRAAARGDLKGVLSEIKSLIGKLRGKDPYWTFDRVMEIEDRLGVRSSFYFLRERGKVDVRDRKSWRKLGRRYDFWEVKDVLERLSSGGWEVGLHGSFDSFDNEEMLRAEKEELEKIVGHRVVGIRQHNLNLKIPETWRIHEKLELEYDSSLGSNRELSFRWGTSFPFYPIDDGRFVKVLQIPLLVEDIVLMKREDPWKDLIKLVNIVKRFGGVLTVLWHHSVFGSDYPGWDDLYERLIVLCKGEGAWVCNGKQIAKWWKFRSKAEVDFEIEGKILRVFSEVPVIVDSGGRYVVREG